ncbi:uncharacterized protein LOC141911994 [Tubulanus polymorphus]|uniref:uncharacterized protein LOC141911994 n=1 Tax=Tubulanus polymorphus TaxID=672921 RepID=UPI003DA60FF4
MGMFRYSSIWVVLFSSGFLMTATSAKTMRVVCIVTDHFPNMQERVEYFWTAIARVQGQEYNATKPSIDFTFVDVRSEINDGVGLNEKLKKVLQANYDAAIGPPVEYFQRYIGTEYFVVGDGLQAKACPSYDGVHNVLPTLDQAMSLVFPFIKSTEDKLCYDFIIITHNTGELDDFLHAFVSYSDQFRGYEKLCFKYYPLVTGWTKGATMYENIDPETFDQVKTARTFGVSHIIVFSRMPNAYHPFEAATNFDMNSYLYRWLYLTYENVPYKSLSAAHVPQTNPSLSFLDMFNDNLVKAYNLAGLQTDHKSRDFGLFDTILTLYEFAGRQIRRKSEKFFDAKVEVNGFSGRFSFSLMNCREAPAVKYCETDANENRTQCEMTDLEYMDWNVLDQANPIKILPDDGVKVFSANLGRILIRLEPPFFIRSESGHVSGILFDLLEIYKISIDVAFEYFEYSLGEDLLDRLQGFGEVAAGGFSIDLERETIVDFSDPIYPASLHLVSKLPAVEKNRWQFLKPFVSTLWLVVLATILVISILLSLLTFIDYTTDTISLVDSFYFTVARLSSGSSETNPNAIPSRILVAVVMFFGMALSAAYTANMTAFLRLRADDQPITSLSELIERGEGNFGVIGYTEVAKILSKSQKFPDIIVWNIIRRTGNVLPDLETAVERIVNENFILITDTLTARYAVAQRCDLIEHELKQLYGLRFALALPKGALVKRPIDALIASIRESGEQKKVEDKYMKRQFPCNVRDGWSNEISKTEPLTFFEMSGVFFTLIIGLAVASFVALIEHSVLLYRRAKLQENGGDDPSKQSTEPVPL